MTPSKKNATRQAIITNERNKQVHSRIKHTESIRFRLFAYNDCFKSFFLNDCRTIVRQSLAKYDTI